MSQEGQGVEGSVGNDLSAGSEESTPQTFRKNAGGYSNDIFKLIKEMNVSDGSKATGSGRFWSTQPVVQDNARNSVRNVNGPIKEMTIEEIRKEPYNLVDGFEWDDLDLNNEDNLSELYTLLNENYVEDDDNMFRFDYSRQFLRWALCPPEFVANWHVGVRVTKSHKLVGFIGAIPAGIRVRDKSIDTVEINFLCVHKKLRSKRLAPVLIKEITRRVNVKGRFQAVYTSGTVLPGVIGRSSYYHRSLNVKKLLDVKFTYLNPKMTVQRLTKLLRLPTETQTHGFREMRKNDHREVFELLNNHLNRYDIVQLFTFDEFEHIFSSQDGVVYSFVVEQDDKQLTDFCSFYILSSTVVQHINNPVNRSLVAAYLYYSATTKTPLLALIKDCLITAKALGCDVFNALDLMDNGATLKELKFGLGDGTLQYYLYNWQTDFIRNDKIGIVLL
ncbi:hypothetical protein ACOME3_002041 [Neoechinorhynchus agilis]